MQIQSFFKNRLIYFKRKFTQLFLQLMIFSLFSRTWISTVRRSSSGQCTGPLLRQNVNDIRTCLVNIFLTQCTDPLLRQNVNDIRTCLVNIFLTQYFYLCIDENHIVKTLCSLINLNITEINTLVKHVFISEMSVIDFRTLLCLLFFTKNMLFIIIILLQNVFYT